MNRVDVSVVATFHREGAVAIPTLKAIELCRKAAVDAGLRVEVIATLDRADAETRDIVLAWCRSSEDARAVELDVGDLGLARNAGFALATGAYGSTIDGDDLLSPHWLVRAHRQVSTGAPSAVVHPEYVIEFGAGKGITRLRGMDVSSDLVSSLMATHPWTSCGFAPMEAYHEAPYLGCTGRWAGFGFEDWHWNVEQLSLGRSHMVAPRTFLLYRKRPDSLLAEQIRANRIVGPLQIFSPESVLARRPNEDQGSDHNAQPQRASVGARLVEVARSILSRVGKPTDEEGVVPAWAFPDLDSLHAFDLAVPNTPESFEDYSYWEPKLNPSVGVAYERVMRQLWMPDAGRFAEFAVAETPQAVSHAAERCREKIVVMARRGQEFDGILSTAPIIYGRLVFIDDRDLLTADEADILLTRLLVQLRPPRVNFERTQRLSGLADRCGPAFSTLRVEIAWNDWQAARITNTTTGN